MATTTSDIQKRINRTTGVLVSGHQRLSIDEIKDERKQMNKQKDAENSASFYFTVICEDESQRTALMKKMGVPIYEEFVTADKLKKL